LRASSNKEFRAWKEKIEFYKKRKSTSSGTVLVFLFFPVLFDTIFFSEKDKDKKGAQPGRNNRTLSIQTVKEEDSQASSTNKPHVDPFAVEDHPPVIRAVPTKMAEAHQLRERLLEKHATLQTFLRTLYDLDLRSKVNKHIIL